MKFEYQFTRTSFKQLKKLKPATRKRILKKLDYFCQSGKPLHFAHQLTAFSLGSYRFRVGDYRIIFDVESEGELLIHLIGHRREIYR